MIDLAEYEFWFLTGSQDLYGEETLKQVAVNSKKIVDELNAKKVCVERNAFNAREHSQDA